MRFASLLAVLALAACGGDDADPHAPATCVGWVDNQGNPITGTCEAACAMPPASTGDSCDTVKQLNCAKFEFSGQDGCCLADGDTIKFYECAP
jgi:hypothetical protein